MTNEEKVSFAKVSELKLDIKNMSQIFNSLPESFPADKSFCKTYRCDYFFNNFQ
ncbi:MAG: hypothetical protein IKI22_03725 [Neisseriaceae bacterium]|nr:hypothetical protein [Neisseriaceae bacterium]